ncbi:hypothetical protein HDU93_004877, partial [Gonapodya sp. JEL0774]
MTNATGQSSGSVEMMRAVWTQKQNETRSKLELSDRLDFRVVVNPIAVPAVASNYSTRPADSPPDSPLTLTSAFLISRGSTSSFAYSFPGLRYVGGVDIGFDHEQDRGSTGPSPQGEADEAAPQGAVAVAVLVVMEVLPDGSLEVVYSDKEEGHLALPYIPTFLAFREIPLLLPLFQRLRTHPSQSHLFPQLVLVDGQGTFHPRMCGLASQLGVELDVPCVGVGKNFLWIENEDMEEYGVKEAVRELRNQGGGPNTMKGVGPLPGIGTGVKGVASTATEARSTTSAVVESATGGAPGRRAGVPGTCMGKAMGLLRAHDAGDRTAAASGLVICPSVATPTPSPHLSYASIARAAGSAVAPIRNPAAVASHSTLGDFYPLIGASGAVYGSALLPTAQTSNPIYVSPGHRISALTALLVVKWLSKLAVDLLNPSTASEKQKHKLKRLVQSPNSFFMDVKCG